MTEEQQKQEGKNININAHYLKDISFENPNSPASLTSTEKPNVEFALDLEVNALKNEGAYELVLSFSAKAETKEMTIFSIDVKYAGIFTLQNINDEEKSYILAVHCANILFPYVRRVISDMTRDGGFQPLMIQPIDFHSLFMQKQQEAKDNNQVTEQ